MFVFSRFQFSNIQLINNFCCIAVTEEEIPELFVRKIRQCRVVFDFTKPLSDVEQKDIKQDILLELAEFVTSMSGIFTPLIYKEISEMV